MTKTFTTVLMLLLFAAPAFSQTTEADLEKAVHIYNDMRDFEDSLVAGKVTDADINRLKADIAKAKPLLNNVLENGTTEEKRNARYFNANFQYELGFVYGMMGKNALAYEVLKPIEGDYDYFSTPSVFPLKYKFEEKNYNIKWENFSPTLSEYYTGMGEICVNLNKNEEGLVWSRKSLKASNSTDWYRYIACNKIIEIKKKDKKYDQEMMEVASQMIVLVTTLDSSYQKAVVDYKYPTEMSGYNVLANIADDNLQLSDMGRYYAQAADAMYAKEKYTQAAFLYKFAQGKGYYKEASVDKIVKTAVKVKDTKLGLDAVDKYRATIIAGNCYEYERAVKWYGDLADFKSADELRAEQKKCEKKASRTSSVSSMRDKMSKFHFYIGFDPIGVMNVPKRMNFGGDMAFILEKFGFDFEFHRVQQDWDWPMFIKGGKYRWDGYTGYLGLKGVKNVSSRVAVAFGPQFGFAWKEFSPITSDVMDKTTGTNITKTFTPQERQYRMLLVFDSYTFLSYFGIHLFGGFGFSVNQFIGGQEYNKDNYDLSAKILNTRKPLYVAPQFKAGLTLGLNIPGKRK
jgi:hypothetical protein